MNAIKYTSTNIETLFSTSLLFVFLLFSSSMAQLPAFPGAEGFGKYVSGGRGGTVKIVTNLNDNGSGSLRAAIQSGEKRTIVFQVSGTIELKSALRIQNGNITIAGQTAPGDGICIRNYPLTIDADNVIIRYIRSRLGDEKDVEDDAINGRNQRNIIIDHCSMSWSVDETASFYDNENFTMQWCLISESLYHSVHGKGDHGYGGIWGGKGATFHHNLLAHHSSRNPRFCGSRYSNRPDLELIDHRNNVIYNWGGNSCYGAEGGRYNIVNNYYKSGPATGGTRNRIIHPDADDGSNSQPAGIMGVFYVDGNYVAGYPDIAEDNWDGGVHGIIGDPVDIRSYTPFEVPYVLTQEAEKAFLSVLADAGAVRPARDPIDSRIIEEARTGTATYGGVYGACKGIIDTPSDVGGWPVLNTHEVPTDNDNDGMADDWEDANGLNSSDPNDHNGVAANGYTNLENYLNSLTFRDDYIRAPGDLTATTLSSSEIKLEWKEISSDETGFSIERSENDITNFQEFAVTNPDDTTYTDAGLAEATRYYYRVRAVKNDVHSVYSNIADDKTVYSDGRALEPTNPFPEDNAENVPVATVLRWDKSNCATSYDVYFGTANPPTDFMGNQTETYFNPFGLMDSTVYYWRVDAVNANGTTTGTVWQFTSEPYVKKMHAYWDFNRGFGSTVLDASGYNNSARFNNMNSENWVDDGVNELALQFDGANDYLSVDNDPSLNFSIRGFTLNLWIKKGLSDKVMPWVSKADYEKDSFSTRYEIYSDQNNQIHFTVSDLLNVAIVSTSGVGFFTDEWVMATAVRDKDSQSLKIYLNDQLMGSAPDNSYNVSNDGELLIGTNAALSDFFNGQIDELRLFNYALTPSEIQELYNVTGVRGSEPIPRSFDLTNYPNPFNSKTMIKYSIPKASKVEIDIYNTMGQKVATVVRTQMEAGTYTLNWDGTDDADKVVAAGLYLYRLQSADKIVTRKMLYMK